MSSKDSNYNSDNENSFNSSNRNSSNIFIEGSSQQNLNTNKPPSKIINVNENEHIYYSKVKKKIQISYSGETNSDLNSNQLVEKSTTSSTKNSETKYLELKKGLSFKTIFKTTVELKKNDSKNYFKFQKYFSIFYNSLKRIMILSNYNFKSELSVKTWDDAKKTLLMNYKEILSLSQNKIEFFSDDLRLIDFILDFIKNEKIDSPWKILMKLKDKSNKKKFGYKKLEDLVNNTDKKGTTIDELFNKFLNALQSIAKFEE